MNLNQAKQVLVRTHISALHTNQRALSVELLSGPGVGKSSAVMQSAEDLARELGEPVGVRLFMLATITSADVNGFGLPTREQPVPGIMGFAFTLPPWYPVRTNIHVVTPDGTWFKPGEWAGEVPAAGIEFLDEFGQAPDEVKLPAAELILNGRVGTCELPPGWRVIAASNRMSDRSGVVRAFPFIVNRRLEIKVDPLLPPWLDYMNSLPVGQRPHYLTLSFAQKEPGLVFRDTTPPGTEPFCTPRTLCMMDHALMALRTQEDIKKDALPMDLIAREVARGLIGEGEAAQFFTHCKYFNELPEMADILRDPQKAKLPRAKDAQMVCGYFLAHNVTDKTAEPIMKYINRLDREMQVLSVGTITKRQELAVHVANTKLFTDWLITNKDLLVASKS